MTEKLTPLERRPREPACPVCRRPARPEHRPFCSARCRMVDLGRWFGGAYVVSTPLGERAPDKEDDDEAGTG